jgi:hypothetical protein
LTTKAIPSSALSNMSGQMGQYLASSNPGIHHWDVILPTLKEAYRSDAPPDPERITAMVRERTQQRTQDGREADNNLGEKLRQGHS